MARIYQRIPPEARFWAKVRKTDTCWLWEGYTDRKGYGHFKVGPNHYVLAHRYAFELLNGALPPALCACHNCPDGDNPRCVNPAHLFPGTKSVNNADTSAKGRSARGERSGTAKLTDDLVRAIRAEYRPGKCGYVRLARRYGVNHNTIKAVLSGKTWGHVR